VLQAGLISGKIHAFLIEQRVERIVWWDLDGEASFVLLKFATLDIFSVFT
jgi:hypothetical protein